jgi:CheY-like chemotaxis protein
MHTKVLVVEDDLEINELLGEYLALEHIGYVQATTGAAGVHIASAQHPDAVILDLMLPDMNGFDVARMISMHRATYDIPIIILSCMCQDCDREKGYSSGAMFYMTKPFLPDALLEKVGEALEWKAVLRTRVPQGEVLLGAGDTMACSRGLNQMMADLFARTELSDEVVGQIREAMEMVGQWSVEWQGQHKDAGAVKVAYRITAGDGHDGTVEWELSEAKPGLLAEAFFKTRAAEGRFGSGLIGWGASLAGKEKPAPVPVATPARWLQVLAKTGAGRFEKDIQGNTVRFSRPTANVLNAAPADGPVPVVEVQGTRVVGREKKDEALAGERR